MMLGLSVVFSLTVVVSGLRDAGRRKWLRLLPNRTASCGAPSIQLRDMLNNISFRYIHFHTTFHKPVDYTKSP